MSTNGAASEESPAEEPFTPERTELNDVEFGRWTRRSPVLRGIKIAVHPFVGKFALLSALAVVAAALDTALLYVIARLAVVMTSGERTLVLGLGPLGEVEMPFEEVVGVAAVGLVIVTLVNLPLARLTARVCRQMMLRQRRRLLSAYLESSWAHRSLQPEGHLQEITMSYCHVTEVTVLQLATIIVAVTGLSMLAVASIVIGKLVAVIAFVGLLAFAIVLRPLALRVKRSSSTYAELNRDYASAMAQTARLSPEIATFDVAGAVVEHRRREAEEAGDALERIRFITKITPVLFQYGALGIIVGMIWGLTALDFQDLSLIGPLILLLVRALAYARQLQGAVQTMIHYSPYVEKLEEEIAALTANPAPSGGRPITALEPITFDDVSFRYAADEPVLTSVNLRIEPGEAVGVIGPSGGGKSTLTQLLLRLRRPTTGRILVGGSDLDHIDPSSWSSLVAVVPQDNKLLRGTVVDNIRFYRSHFSLQEVEDAARAAHLHEEILALPNGYETDIGPGASDLSGGQRQRLGIARALVGRPQLLVLDEPTSALDQRSEHLIRETLLDLRGTTTLVVVAHRPATLEVCDRVLSVSGGTIESVLVGAQTPST